MSAANIIQSTAHQVDLPALADRIRAEHQAVQAAMRNGVTHALAAGDGLVQAQSQVPSGQWARWLKENCFFSVRTAQLYMQLAGNRGDIEAEISRAPDLSLRAARRLISKPKSELATPGKRTTARAGAAAAVAVDTAAVKFASTLTKALRLALSLQRSEKSPTPALAGILSKLTAKRLDLHDIAIVVRPSPRGRAPRAGRRAA